MGTAGAFTLTLFGLDLLLKPLCLTLTASWCLLVRSLRVDLIWSWLVTAGQANPHRPRQPGQPAKGMRQVRRSGPKHHRAIRWVRGEQGSQQDSGLCPRVGEHTVASTPDQGASNVPSSWIARSSVVQRQPNHARPFPHNQCAMPVSNQRHPACKAGALPLS